MNLLWSQKKSKFAVLTTDETHGIKNSHPRTSHWIFFILLHCGFYSEGERERKIIALKPQSPINSHQDEIHHE